MKISEKEFKESITDNAKRVYLELILSDLLGIDFDQIHNQIVIDDPDIVNDTSIPIKKRPNATIISFTEYIVILFKNNFFAEKSSWTVEEIMRKISHKYPDKKIAGINFNDFEDN